MSRHHFSEGVAGVKLLNCTIIASLVGVPIKFTIQDWLLKCFTTNFSYQLVSMLYAYKCGNNGYASLAIFAAYEKKLSCFY